MRRRLSSSMTVIWKIVFPGIWLIAFGGMTLRMVVQRPSSFPWFLFPILTVFALLMFGWLAFPLKQVDLEQGTLVVSNFRREIRVSLEEIVRVVETGTRPPQIVVVLRSDTPFGRKIRFTPGGKVAFFGEHAITKELRELAGLPPG